MYERTVIHATQNVNVKDPETRYRFYKTKASRDSAFNKMQEVEPDPDIEKVTLTIIAETVTEPLTLL